MKDERNNGRESEGTNDFIGLALQREVGPIGGDAEAFREAVRARIAERQPRGRSEGASRGRANRDSAGRDTAGRAAGTRGSDDQNSDHPAQERSGDVWSLTRATEVTGARPRPWVRRAALILPPGLLEWALLGKASGAAKGVSSVPVLGALAAPWILVAAWVVGTLSAARVLSRPDASRAGDPPSDSTARGRRLRSPVRFTSWVPSLVLACSALWFTVFALYVGHVVWLPVLFGLIVGGLTLGVVVLSRAGLADRERVAKLARECLAQLLLLVFVTQGVFGSPGYWSRVATIPLLISGFLVCAAVVRVRFVANALYVALFLGLMGFNSRFIEVPLDWNEAELVAWIDDRTPDVADLNEWEIVGEVISELPQPARVGLDLEGLYAALALGAEQRVDLHPMVALGAERAGVLPADELQRQARVDLLRDNAFKSPHPYLVQANESHMLDMLAMRRSDHLAADDAIGTAAARGRRSRVLDGIERALPHPEDFQAVVATELLLQMGDALGDPELAGRHRAALNAVLTAAWQQDSEGHAGFGPWPLGHPEHQPYVEDEAGLAAVQLMRRIGVPEAIDLGALDGGLERLSYSRVGRDPRPASVRAALARHVLRRDLALPQRSLLGSLEREAVFLSALATVILALWAVLRAPPVRRWDVGPLAPPRRAG